MQPAIGDGPPAGRGARAVTGESAVPRAVILGGLALVCAVIAAGAVALTLMHRSPYSHTRPGGPFALVDTGGRPVTEADLAGRPTAIAFGFTSCPEVCPTTLSLLTEVMGRMGGAADRLNVVFVTVDPERDTPEALKLYLSSFDPRIRGFTGTAAQVAAMADAYHVAYRRVPAEGGYTMEHPADVFLFDRTGRLGGVIDYGEDEAGALGKLTMLAAPGTCVPGVAEPSSLWDRPTPGRAPGLCGAG